MSEPKSVKRFNLLKGLRAYVRPITHVFFGGILVASMFFAGQKNRLNLADSATIGSY